MTSKEIIAYRDRLAEKHAGLLIEEQVMSMDITSLKKETESLSKFKDFMVTKKCVEIQKKILNLLKKVGPLNTRARLLSMGIHTLDSVIAYEKGKNDGS